MFAWNEVVFENQDKVRNAIENGSEVTVNRKPGYDEDGLTTGGGRGSTLTASERKWWSTNHRL